MEKRPCDCQRASVAGYFCKRSATPATPATPALFVEKSSLFGAEVGHPSSATKSNIRIVRYHLDVVERSPCRVRHLSSGRRLLMLLDRRLPKSFDTVAIVDPFVSLARR